MEVKRIDHISEIDATALNHLAGNSDPFLSHEFLLALEQSGSVCSAAGWQPQHLVVYENNELIGFMPLYQKMHSWGEYVFDNQWAHAYRQAGMAYYPKWLTAIPFTPCQGQRFVVKKKYNKQRVAETLIAYIIEHAQQSNVSSWHCLFPEPQQVQQLKKLGMSVREDIQFHWYNKGYRDFKDFLETFSSKNRKKINRERRRIAEQGIELQRISGPDISSVQWQVFYGFYQMTYLKRGMQAYLTSNFFTLLAETMPEKLLLVLAIKHKQYVGAALSFIGDDTFYGRYWGCNEDYPSLHFETCYYQGLEFCLQQGLKRFDSGAQGEHKISRGFEPVTTYSAHWIKNLQFAQAIKDFLIREKRLINHYKNDAATNLPFKRNVE